MPRLPQIRLRTFFFLPALACVAIPTITAFLFLFWLGPWYLY